MKIVPQNHQFRFKALCPYCGGDIVCQADSWEQLDNGEWRADHFDIECDNQPDMEDVDEWQDWLTGHSFMPYEEWLPMVRGVEDYIDKTYRFKL